MKNCLKITLNPAKAAAVAIEREKEPNMRTQTIYNRWMDDNSQFMNCVKCVYIIFMCEIKKITEITCSGISFPINLYEIYAYAEIFFVVLIIRIVGSAHTRKNSLLFDFKTIHSRLRNSFNFHFLWMWSSVTYCDGVSDNAEKKKRNCFLLSLTLQ